MLLLKILISAISSCLSSNLKPGDQFKTISKLGLLSARNEVLDLNKLILRNNFSQKGGSKDSMITKPETSTDPVVILKEKLLQFKNESNRNRWYYYCG